MRKLFGDTIKTACIIAGVCMLTACGAADKEATTTDETAADSNSPRTETASDSEAVETATETSTEIVDLEDETEHEHTSEPSYNASQYVELGDYIGIDVEVTKKEAVTDEQVSEEINYEIESNDLYVKQDKDIVEEGDVVNIDYAGTIGGEEFEGGTDSGAHLTIGSGMFIEGFEEQLIGTKVGDTVIVKVTFPEDYYEDLVGKDAEFTVTINSIDKLMEYGDDAAVALSNGEYQTMADYENSVRDRLEETAESEYMDNARSAVADRLKEVCTITDYPEDVVNYRVNETVEYYQEYADYLGQDMETMIKENMGSTYDEFLDQIRADAEDSLASDMILKAIVEKENIELSEDEYQETVKKLAEQYWYESAEAFEEEYGKDYIFSTLLLDKAADFVYANANVTEVEAEELSLEDLGLELETEMVLEEETEDITEA